jgi:hypothetical protein
MKILLAISLVVLSTTSAHADFFYKLVGYECDQQANAVIITYAGALNQAGKKMIKNKAPRQWDPWSLAVKDKNNENYIASLKNVHGQCMLRDGIYEITIGALPGNVNLQGKCGGFMSAWAEVRRDSEIVLPRHALEYGDCHVAQPVTTRIIIEAGGKEPVIKKVPWDDFYKNAGGEEE